MKFNDLKFYVYTNGSRDQKTYRFLNELGADVKLMNGSGKPVDLTDENEIIAPDNSVLGAHRNIVADCELLGVEKVWIAEDGIRKIFVQDEETFLWKKLANIKEDEIQNAILSSSEAFDELKLDYMPTVLRVGVKRDKMGTIEINDGVLKKLGTTFTLWKVSSLKSLINKLDELSGHMEISHGLDLMFAGTSAVLGFQNAIDYSLGADEIPNSTLRTENNDAFRRVRDIKHFTFLFPNVKLFFSWSKAQPHSVELTEENQVENNIKALKHNIGLIKNEEYKAKMETAFAEIFGEG